MPSLLLHPRDPSWTPPDQGAFDSLLRQTGLSGDRRGEHEFCVGPQFQKLIVFLGCSPRVVTASGAADGAVCHLFYRKYPEVRFLSAAGRPQARCPACRAPVDDTEIRTYNHPVRCICCGHEGPLAHLDWRQAAGFARFFVEIAAIHPHEAVPADKLLGTLYHYSAMPWHYFYKG